MKTFIAGLTLLLAAAAQAAYPERSIRLVVPFPAGSGTDIVARELAEKDVGLGVELGRSLRLPMPAATLVRQMFGLALLEGHRGEDAVATFAMCQDWARRSRAQREEER